ncbi:unnamed protein product [Linum trigynum]|uniref:Uncharacterized protein n=1 Tax=Linum trigynum TaxID=586398 RepID=A0AAV2F8D5_9ROSI
MTSKEKDVDDADLEQVTKDNRGENLSSTETEEDTEQSRIIIRSTVMAEGHTKVLKIVDKEASFSEALENKIQNISTGIKGMSHLVHLHLPQALNLHLLLQHLQLLRQQMELVSQRKM